jgi:hypothetical protein
MRAVGSQKSSTLTYHIPRRREFILKRLSIGLVAVLAMLIAAGSAFAAIDTYSGGYGFKGKAGTKAKPAPLSFTQKFALTSAQAGSLTGILSNVKTEISGVKVDAAGFKTCTTSQINNPNNSKFDAICPKSALVASGSIKAQLGTAAQWAPTGLTCNPVLDVWNAGPGKLSFFFRTTASAQCLGGTITTGAVPAFTATYKQVGSNLLVNIPVPADVTNPGKGPYFVAVTSEYLTWHSTSNSKGTHDITSTGCKGHRHFSYTFSAHTPSGQSETKSIKGEASCK